MPAADTAARCRFDKWLWAARFYRTRALAAAAIDAGQARLNASRVKPAHGVRAGDAVSLRKGAFGWAVRVVAVAERRGSAAEASRLYAEDEASRAARELEIEQRRAAASPTPERPGRPTKRDRRRLEDFLDEP
jgi:ribosome-associated heat shock protein Hsp15